MGKRGGWSQDWWSRQPGARRESVRSALGDGDLIFLASSRHSEEGCMMLAFMLRRICLRDGARRYPSTVPLGHVCLEASCSAIREEGGAIFAEERRWHVWSLNEAAWRFRSPGVEYHRPNYLPYASRPESGLAPFWAHFPMQYRFGLANLKLQKLISGHTAK